MSKRQMGCIGCLFIVLFGSLVLGSCVRRYLQPTQRKPELSIRHFLESQLEALPPGWTLGKADIWTDTDFTWAQWAVAVNFKYKKSLHFAGEEIHVFPNPYLAQIIERPSPSSVTAGTGYVPMGWTYHPPHADQFEFGCSGGDEVAQPEGCSLILRYEEYVIVFGTSIADYMTLEDLKRLLEVIDREMADFLQHSTLQPGPRKVPKSLDP